MYHESTAYPVITQEGPYVARLLPFPNGWMIGDIEGADYTDHEDERRVMATGVLRSLHVVAERDRNGSTCTDGRPREGLADGSNDIEVTEPLVGASSVQGVRIGESLGKKFYPNEDMTLEQRIAYAHDHMVANGEMVRTHRGCGAANGMITVMTNELDFGVNRNFRRRMAALMPDGVYDDRMHDRELRTLDRRLDNGLYVAYAADLITSSVVRLNGQRAVEHYTDDGTGVSGHNEKAIAVTDIDLEGTAVDPNRLISLTGNQAFTQSMSKQDRLARLFSNGGDDEEAYVTGWHAQASFASAGHGTLGHNLETWLISRAA